jgi:multiple sugar transport system substrate-binding protein
VLEAPDWKRAAFNTQAAAETLDLRRRMIEEGIVTRGALSYSFDDAINAMAQGRAAMSIMFSAYWSRLNDPASSTIVGNVGYAPVPRDPGVERAHFVRGWSVLMNKASRNKEAAWEFIRYYTSPEMQAQMAIRFGNPISRISVAQRTDVAAAVPVMPAIAESLPKAKIQPNTPQLSRVWEVLSLHVSAATAGTTPAADALAAAEAKVNALLA